MKNLASVGLAICLVTLLRWGDVSAEPTKPAVNSADDPIAKVPPDLVAPFRAAADHVAKATPDLVVALRAIADRVAAAPADSFPDYSIGPVLRASVLRAIADHFDPIVDAVVAAVRDGATAIDAAIAFNAFLVIDTVTIKAITSLSDDVGDAAKKDITDDAVVLVQTAIYAALGAVVPVQTAIDAALGAAVPGDFVVAARAALGAAADRVAEDAAALVATSGLDAEVRAAVADAADRAVSAVRDGAKISDAASAFFEVRDVVFKNKVIWRSDDRLVARASKLGVDAAIAGHTASSRLVSAIRTEMER